MKLAPIILFVYNRPWHTEQTLEALRKNEFADQSTLYIYCDGPKIEASKKDFKSVKEVRSVIREKQWCKEVIIIEKDVNSGLSESVIKGVSEVIESHGKVIVLEDDIVVGKHFLKFMNDGLNVYESNDKVYGVSGYCFPYSGKIIEKTFFLPIMSSWGYATWHSRWDKINFNGKELLEKVKSKKIGTKLNFSNISYYQMLQDQVAGKNDSWAVRFYVSMFLKKGVFLYPNLSLLKNIGLDGTGVHCGIVPNKIHSGNYNETIEIPIQKINVEPRPEILRNFQSRMNSKFRFKTSVKRNVLRLMALEIITLIKRKLKFKSEVKKNKAVIPRYTKLTVFLEGKNIKVPDVASFKFMKEEIFEQNIYKFESSSTTPYIIDGGANIGLATIYFKLLYPTSKIVAFEPDPEVFQDLKFNVEAFGFQNVSLVQKGLWNSNKVLPFKAEGADAGLIGEIDRFNSTDEQEIEVVSLKTYLQQPVDFLKLDIEGSETIVLKDIKEDLKNVKNIFVEYHSFVNQKQTLNEVIEILTSANFRLHISSPGLTSSSPFIKLNTYNNMDMQLNIYGIKQDPS